MINSKLRAELEASLNLLENTRGKPFSEWVRLVGLDPAKDFIGTDLKNQDFRSQSLDGFDFAGSDLRGSKFHGAKIAGANLGDAIVDMRDLSKASDWKKFLRGYSPPNFAIALDDDVTEIYASGRGIIMKEPSVVAFRTSGSRKEVLSAGRSALKMQSNERVKVGHPIQRGNIADIELAGEMLARYLGTVHSVEASSAPMMLLAAKSYVPAQEKRLLSKIAIDAGARETHFIEEQLATAYGAGLVVRQETGLMVIGIDKSYTSISVFSFGSSVYTRDVSIGTRSLAATLGRAIRSRCGIGLPLHHLESILMQYGAAVRPSATEIKSFKVQGYIDSENTRRTANLDSLFAHLQLRNSYEKIVEGVKIALSQISPELSGDLAAYGLVLTGPGATLPELAQLISEETGMPVNISSDPSHSKINGCGYVLENWESLKHEIATVDV